MKKMIGVVIVTHSALADEFLMATQQIVGTIEGIEPITPIQSYLLYDLPQSFVEMNLFVEKHPEVVKKKISGSATTRTRPIMERRSTLKGLRLINPSSSFIFA